jgi:hypothetical protein
MASPGGGGGGGALMGARQPRDCNLWAFGLRSLALGFALID